MEQDRREFRILQFPVRAPASRTEAIQTGAPQVLVSGSFQVQVVGSSHHQDLLAEIAGGRRRDGVDVGMLAVLVPEPHNPHDANAVAAHLDGRIAGHLARENAAILQPAVMRLAAEHGAAVACAARIVGGWDRGRHDRGHFGVRIYVDPSSLGIDRHALFGEWVSTSESSRAGDPPHRLGLLDGRYHREYRDEVQRLRRSGAEQEAERLLLRLLGPAEQDALGRGWGPEPWPYEQLAVILRKRGDLDAEVAVLERFAACPRPLGDPPAPLLDRLERARILRDRRASSEA